MLPKLKIFRYSITTELGLVEILLPEGAEILNAEQDSDKQFSIWALVDPGAKLVKQTLLWCVCEDSEDGYFSLEVPLNARILAAQFWGGDRILFLLSGEKLVEKRDFFVVGTGDEILQSSGKDMLYVGTYREFPGAAVWHIFEIRPTK